MTIILIWLLCSCISYSLAHLIIYLCEADWNLYYRYINILFSIILGPFGVVVYLGFLTLILIENFSYIDKYKKKVKW